MNDLKIYKEYISREEFNLTALDVANNNGITRNTLYNVIKRVENGSPGKVRQCEARARFDCLWQHKYQNRYEALPKDRRQETILALIRLVNDMKKDKFSVRMIATRLKKDRSSVSNLLGKK